MWQEIGDGAYDCPIDCGVIPIELDIRGEELHIVVESPSEVAVLADAIAATTMHCQESYRASRC